MNHKPLFLAVTLVALLIIGGVFWVMEKRPVATHQSVVTKPVAEAPIQTEPEKYPQYIETIPGDTDEVWYNIPELGVRMKLNKEFAMSLIYQYSHKVISKGEWDVVDFSTKELIAIDKGCSPKEGSPLGSITKEITKENNDYFFSAPSRTQIGGYHFVWIGLQTVTCGDLKNEEVIQKTKSAKDYADSGAKYFSDGMKTLELIP